MVASLKLIEEFVELPKKPSTITLPSGQNVSTSTYDVDTICEILVRQGFEVESLTEKGIGLNSVVVGKIIEASKHPNANKLQVCKVDVGENTLRQIVCGAGNARENLYVAVALPGAKLPNGMEIKDASIRDIPSSGMLCSRSELGLPIMKEIDGEGIWEINDSLQGGIPESSLQNLIGYPVYLALNLSDVIIDLSITPNRPDMRSHQGIARELAIGFAFNNIPFTEKKPREFSSLISLEQLFLDVLTTKNINFHSYNFSVQNALGVPAFFVGLENIEVKPSPSWLRNLLENLGQNSVNNIVDASNYILLTYGQPSHAFDFDKLACEPNTKNKSITLRFASENESFLGLDGKERNLTINDCVVADAAGPQALLGVIGGEKTKVDFTTKNIVLEIANAHHVSVRRSSRRHGRQTDSSMAFEKGIDVVARWEVATKLIGMIASYSEEKPTLVGGVHSQLINREPQALELYTEQELTKMYGPLYTEKICIDPSVTIINKELIYSSVVNSDKKLDSILEHLEKFIACESLKFNYEFTAQDEIKILGTSVLPFPDQLVLLSSLGFTVQNINATSAIITVPPWRWKDIGGTADLVEEIIRVVGIDKVPSTSLPPCTINMLDDEHYAVFEKVSSKVTALGYHEVSDFHFMFENDLKKLGLKSNNTLGEPILTLNPANKYEPFLQTTLIPGLLKKALSNLNYGLKRGQIYHLARTYQNLNAAGERVFDSELSEDSANKSSNYTNLYEYNPQFSFPYSKEKNNLTRPAETPRIAGLVFGNKEEKTWQNTAATPWDLHSVMAHVLEIVKSLGCQIEVEKMPSDHPMADALHPGKRVIFSVLLNNESLNINSTSSSPSKVTCGWAGTIHPATQRNFELTEQCIVFELNLAIIYFARNINSRVSTKIFMPKFPMVSKDFAFIFADKITAKEIESCVKSCLTEFLPKIATELREIKIYDIYKGKNIQEGKKSVTFNILLAPEEKTLTESDIQGVLNLVCQRVSADLQGELRS